MNDRASRGPERPPRLAALADSVRARRKALGLRQGELADLADCSTRFVHMLEQGKPTVRLDKVLDVLAVVGLGLRVQPGPGEIEPPVEVS